MKSLLNILDESISKTALGLRHKMWKQSFTDITRGQYVDLLEINGEGVVDYLMLSCDTSTSTCAFKITCDDKVWEWSASDRSQCRIFSEQAIYGTYKDSSYEYFVTPYLINSNYVTSFRSDYVNVKDMDSLPNKPDSYDLLTGGFRFENTFKISVMNNNGYLVYASALYRIG